MLGDHCRATADESGELGQRRCWSREQRLNYPLTFATVKDGENIVLAKRGLWEGIRHLPIIARTRKREDCETAL